MRLQFKWLVLMEGLRYYQAPGCLCAIPPPARSDLKTCSATCTKTA
jgi:hypothetical protein